MPGPIVSINFGSGITHSGMRESLPYGNLRSIKRFYAPLPDDVLSAMPFLSAWQEDNWKAWESFLLVIDSPIYNARGVFFGPNQRNRVIPNVPMAPFPLPKSVLDKYESLKEWQVENARLWLKICHILKLRIETDEKYGGDPEKYGELTMEEAEAITDFGLWDLQE